MLMPLLPPWAPGLLPLPPGPSLVLPPAPSLLPTPVPWLLLLPPGPPCRLLGCAVKGGFHALPCTR